MTKQECPFGKQGWTPERLGSLQGKTCAVTGANSGIGLEASKIFASKGARVLMLCRNPQKAEAALAIVKEHAADGGDASAVRMDLSDLGSVREAAEEVRAQADSLDALVCNAGIMMPPKRTLTKDGHELQFGVNHLGHFLLAGLLLDLVEKAQGRIVSVSSIAHKMGLKRIKFEDLNFDKGYSPMTSYAQSKLANMLFIHELERRLKAAGKPVSAVRCHPGYSDTNLQSTGPGSVWTKVFSLTNKLFAQSAERGSWPLVLAAAEPEAKGGAYYGPSSRRETVGPVRECQPKPQALDPEAAAKLWAVSEEKAGFKWAI